MHFEEQYKELVVRIMTEGSYINPSKGPAREVVGHTITLEPGVVPLIQGRKMFYDGVVGELQGFLNNAQTDEEFKSYGCNFWGAWTGQGVDYSRLLHDFNGVNQLKKVIKTLRDKPDSRKHVISLWDPSSPTLQPPCVMHYQWIVSDNKLNLVWSQRSADVMVGLASDMFSAWLFNKLMALATGYEPGKVVMQIGSAHIYDVHDPSEYLDREVETDNVITCNIRMHSLQDFEVSLTGYEPQAYIKYKLCE